MAAVSMNLLIVIGTLALVGSFFSGLLKLLLAPESMSNQFRYRRAAEHRAAARNNHTGGFGGLTKLGLSVKYSLQSHYNHPADFSRPEFLLSKEELSFYGVLKRAVKDTDVVFAKVRLADVLMPAKDQARLWRRRADKKISGRQFDFIICAANDLAIMLAIELDEVSDTAVKQDYFLDSACESAGLPLLRVNVASGYALGNIKERLAIAMPSSMVMPAGNIHEADSNDSDAATSDPMPDVNVAWLPVRAKPV